MTISTKDNLSFHVGSADELPFDNQLFDVVINVESQILISFF